MRKFTPFGKYGPKVFLRARMVCIDLEMYFEKITYINRKKKPQFLFQINQISFISIDGNALHQFDKCQ